TEAAAEEPRGDALRRPGLRQQQRRRRHERRVKLGALLLSKNSESPRPDQFQGAVSAGRRRGALRGGERLPARPCLAVFAELGWHQPSGSQRRISAVAPSSQSETGVLIQNKNGSKPPVGT